MLTDEYFYIEEIPQPVKEVDAEIVETYSEGFIKRDESEYSVAKKRSQDFRLHEIEQQLHTAEKRCNTLKGQLDYMKMMYQGTTPKLRKTPRQQISNSPRKSYHRSRITSVVDRDGKGDKYHDLPTREEPILSPKHRPGVANVPTLALHQDDELPVKDTDNQMPIGDRRRRASPLPLPLPSPRFSANPEQTINNILTGITDSVNRISLLNDHISEDIKSNVTLNKKIPHKKNPKLHNPASTKSGVQFISMVPKKLASKNSIATYDRKKYMKRTLSETYIKKSPKLVLSDNIRKITAARNAMKRQLKGPASIHPDSSETLRKMKKRSISLIQPKESLHRNKLQPRDPSVENRNKIHCREVPKKFDDTASVKSKSLRKHRPSTSSIIKKIAKKKAKLPNQLAEEQGFETKIRDWQADNLVELYHNEAAKSDTESEDRGLEHRQLKNKLKREINGPSLTKDLSHERALNYGKEIAKHTKNMQQIRLPNIPVIENISQNIESPRRALSPIAENIPGSVTISKITTNTNTNRLRSKSLQRSGIVTNEGIFNGYELPTIASRLKQVAKNYYQKYVCHSIPFIPTRSTTPSHNLGLNIQQALSIFKHRQPSINGLSPTLAINMGIAANEGNGISRPVSTLLSRLGSHVNYNNRRAPSVKQSQQIGGGCPLLRHAGSNSVGLDESPDQSPLISPRIGTSLPIQNFKVSEIDDRDVRERMLTEWDQASPRHKQGERCTCLPRHYVDQNKMLNKYLPEQHLREGGDQPSKQQIGAVREKCLPSMHSMRHNSKNEQNQKKDEVLNEKIKGLRQVLVQLHEDFTNLNEKYEKLQVLVKENQMDDAEASMELEKIEKDLKTKEEEINIVVGLYKEVLALKEQVKVLRERTSQISIVPSVFHPSRRSSLMSRSPYRNEPTATLRLTKLLRQVQNFQEQLKMY